MAYANLIVAMKVGTTNGDVLAVARGHAGRLGARVIGVACQPIGHVCGCQRSCSTRIASNAPGERPRTSGLAERTSEACHDRPMLFEDLLCVFQCHATEHEVVPEFPSSWERSPQIRHGRPNSPGK